MDPFSFQGQPIVGSTMASVTTLYAEPKPGQPEGAQLRYKKNTHDVIATAAVFLDSPHHREQIDTDFAPIPQECSCYWLNATELSTKFPKLVTGQYHLTFESSDYTVRSGSFELDLPTPPTVIDDMAPPIIPDPKPSPKANLVVETPINATTVSSSKSNTRPHLPSPLLATFLATLCLLLH